MHGGGTLAVMLANHALRRGYAATIYTYNLEVFDPTWFEGEGRDLPQKLQARRAAKKKPKLRQAIDAYLEFLQLGGRLRLEDLTRELLRRHLKAGTPLLTGLSATYLYRSSREVGEHKIRYDDIQGDPQGHFVILCGYRAEDRTVVVADPFFPNPMASGQYYEVGIDRAIGAILLGVLTYDANFLLLRPANAGQGDSHGHPDCR